jgi:hypothetical protein
MRHCRRRLCAASSWPNQARRLANIFVGREQAVNVQTYGRMSLKT